MISTIERGKIEMLTIKEARINRNLTQKEVAFAIGTNEATFNQYEMYRRKPNVITAIEICEILGVAVEEVFREEYYIKKSS